MQFDSDSEPMNRLQIHKAATVGRAKMNMERWIHVAKLLRAHGGCLGVRRLRRAWKTAISPVELSNER
jgi:hypothetical protein